MLIKVNLDRAENNAMVLKGLNEMRNEKDLCDFTIKVGEDEYPAHRNVLSVGSEYFRAMLRHDTKENQLSEVNMKDVDSECVKCCIDFIYTANFEIPLEKTGNLLHAAEVMQLKKVSAATIEILENSLCTENFFFTKETAKLFNLANLQTKCKSFEKVNIMALSAQPEFQKEEKSHIIDIMKSKKISLSEEEKLGILINWIGREEDKKTHVAHLLKFIKLEVVSSQYLGNLMKNNPLFSSDLPTYKILSEVILDRVILSEKQKVGEQEVNRSRSDYSGVHGDLKPNSKLSTHKQLSGPKILPAWKTIMPRTDSPSDSSDLSDSSDSSD